MDTDPSARPDDDFPDPGELMTLDLTTRERGRETTEGGREGAQPQGTGESTTSIERDQPASDPYQPGYRPKVSKPTPSTPSTSRARNADRMRQARASKKKKKDGFADLPKIGTINAEEYDRLADAARQGEIDRNELIRTLERIIRSSTIPAEQINAGKTLMLLRPELVATSETTDPDPADLVAWLAGHHKGVRDPVAQLAHLGGPARLLSRMSYLFGLRKGDWLAALARFPDDEPESQPDNPDATPSDATLSA